jgi:diguanylate cyclase (GGDEF)-like protein
LLKAGSKELRARPDWKQSTGVTYLCKPYHFRIIPAPTSRSISLVLLLLLFSCVSAYADRFEARLFGQNAGVGNLSITAFAQQADGLLWIATENGLFRYDGSVFTQYGRAQGLKDPTVYSLWIDNGGTVWAGTHDGLFGFNGHSFQEVKLQSHTLRIGMNSMLGSSAMGELIADTPKGLVSIERSTDSPAWTAMLYGQRHPRFPKLGDDTDGVAVDKAGRLWFGCMSGLCVYGRAGMLRYGPAQGVDKDYYVSLFCARDGRMWARGRKHILTWRPGDAHIADVTEGFPAGAINTVFRRFTEDAGGNILTPTAKGFATWNGETWAETTHTSKGPIEGATSVFCDREGSIWIGTQGFGALQSLGYHRWQNYGVEQGLGSPAVSAIAADSRGRLWFGTNLGADMLAPGAGTIQPTAINHEKDGPSITSFAPTPDGGMWAAALLGHIYHLNAAGVVDFRTSLDGYIQRIRVDGTGKLWIATTSGLFTLERVPDRPAKPELFAAQALLGAHVMDLLFDPLGNTWLVSTRGLGRIHNGQFTQIQMPGGRQSLNVLARGSDGTFWVAGDFPGVMHLRVDGNRAIVLASLAQPQLASDFVEFLGVDGDQRVWIGTDNGVNVVASGQVLYLSHQDGLIWNVCSSNSFLAAEDGSVWLGTSLGVSHLRRPNEVLSRPPFAARIETTQYEGEGITPGRRLPWAGAALVVHFTGLTFRNNLSLLYHYSLSGAQADAAVTSQPFARFEGLPPGSYVLRVVAEDAGHKVFSSPATLAFRLTPPWWRTTYFFALLGILCMAGLRFLWRWRHTALLRRQARLEALVMSRTRELQQMALYDELTGLQNRKAIFATLELAYAEARKSGENLYVALVDIDHFKQVNDTYGHLAGDMVLREAAQRLLASVRASDMVGRYGGEEFLVVFRGATSLLEMERYETLRRAVCEQPIPWNEQSLTVTCSVGVACIASEKYTTAELLMRADRALYRAKKFGRNRVEVAA